MWEGCQHHGRIWHPLVECHEPTRGALPALLVLNWVGFLVSWVVWWQYLKKSVQELDVWFKILPLQLQGGVKAVMTGMVLAHLVGVSWPSPSSGSTWSTCPKYGKKQIIIHHHLSSTHCYLNPHTSPPSDTFAHLQFPPWRAVVYLTKKMKR